jgi:predicted PurR-regulated permease PerM
MTRTNTSRVLSQLLAVTLAVVVIAALYLAKTVILPFALALLFTFVLGPPVTWLERIRIPRIMAVLCVILAAVAILGTIGWTVFTQLIEVTEDLPAYALNVNNKIESFRPSKTTRFTHAQEALNRLSQQIEALSADVIKDPRPFGRGELRSSPDRPVSVKEVGGSQGRVDALSGVLGFGLSFLLVVVFTFFMLLNREDLRNRLIRLTGQGHINLMTQAMDDTSRRVSRYLSLQLLVNAMFGVIIFVALHFMSLPHAALWGFLAGVLRFIPYVGEPIAAALPIALSVAVFDGWTKTLLIIVIFFGMEIVTGNFLEPHVYGRYTGLSSLAVLIAAIFWTLIWGPVGLILSVPLTVCLVVMGTRVPGLDFLTILLGDQPVMPPDARYYQRLLAYDQRDASRVLETYLKDTSLQELYDAVLIPALNLAEQDRHRNALDESTVTFITQTTKDLMEGLTLRQAGSEQAEATAETSVSGKSHLHAGKDPMHATINSKKITCVPVRDDADEIVGIMLAQLLERAGYSAIVIPIGTVEGMLAETSKSEPDIVCLSALPPYAISHARNLYRRMRTQNAELKIIVGLWNYTEDLAEAASEISGGEPAEICTNLAQITLQTSSALGVPSEK